MNTTTDTIISKKNKKSRVESKSIKLNTSAFRKFALDSGIIKMVAPKAIEEMRFYSRKYLLEPIVKDICNLIQFLMSRTNSKKSFRIVQHEKLKTIIQKYILHNIEESVEIKDDTVIAKKNKDFAFHPLTFRKYVNCLTEEISKVQNIQWSSKCMDLLHISIENELYIVMNTCAKVLNDNTPESRKGNLKLTKKDVCFVFEARYSKR